MTVTGHDEYMDESMQIFSTDRAESMPMNGMTALQQL